MNSQDTQTSAADRVVQELHRRSSRLTDLSENKCVPRATLDQVLGEVIGLRGALGLVLGGKVQGGTADRMGAEYYQQWLAREATTG